MKMHGGIIQWIKIFMHHGPGCLVKEITNDSIDISGKTHLNEGLGKTCLFTESSYGYLERW